MGNWLLHYVPLFNACAAVGIMIIQALNFQQTTRMRLTQKKIERAVNGHTDDLIRKIPDATRPRLENSPPINRDKGEELEGTVDTKKRGFDDGYMFTNSPE